MKERILFFIYFILLIALLMFVTRFLVPSYSMYIWHS